MSDRLSAGELSDLGPVSDGLLPHTYTRLKALAGTRNEEGNATDSPQSAEPGLPCRYAVDDVLQATGEGVVVLSTPVLHVARADTLQQGDQVSEIRDALGRMLLPGPVRVETIGPVASFGTVVRQRATLRGTVIRRAG